MYCLLIVDDEPIIVDGLVDLFNRMDHLNLEVHGAYNAAEAINWMERMKIDIVLSDIKMPEVSGLDLQKRVKAQWPRCKFIFLTGYSDFEYTQEAIRNDGFDFILKTENDTQITKTVERAIFELTSEMNNEQTMLRAKQKYETALPVLQKEYMIAFLNSETAALKNIHQQFDELLIPVDASSRVLIVIGRVDDWLELRNVSDHSLMIYAIQNIAEEYFSSSTVLFSFLYNRQRLVWFIQTKNVDEKSTMLFIQGTLELIQTTCKNLLKLPLSFVMGNEFTEWAAVPQKFDQLKLLFNRGLGAGMELLLFEQPKLTEKISIVHYDTRSRINKVGLLRECLDDGDKEGFKQLFAEIFTAVESIPEDQKENIKLEIYYSLSGIFLAFMNQNDLMAEIDHKMELAMPSKKVLYESWNEIVDYFEELADLVFFQTKQEYQEESKLFIAKIKRFIENHLAEDLSLTRLGEEVQLNPSYLSRLYKQLTGEGISEYITGIRLNKAKLLLTNKHYKIHEISCYVGFLSNAHFHRLFKKAIGMTPIEYRDSLTGK